MTCELGDGGLCKNCKAQHATCARLLRDAFAGVGWDVTVSTAPPLVDTVWTTDPFVCPHGVAHWAEPTGEQLAELVSKRTTNHDQ
jgi:hypothetical protein